MDEDSEPDELQLVYEDLHTAHKRIGELKAIIAALQAALAFYAEPRNYRRALKSASPFPEVPDVMTDEGVRARNTLKLGK